MPGPPPRICPRQRRQAPHTGRAARRSRGPRWAGGTSGRVRPRGGRPHGPGRSEPSAHAKHTRFSGPRGVQGGPRAARVAAPRTEAPGSAQARALTGEGLGGPKERPARGRLSALTAAGARPRPPPPPRSPCRGCCPWRLHCAAGPPARAPAAPATAGTAAPADPGSACPARCKRPRRGCWARGAPRAAASGPAAGEGALLTCRPTAGCSPSGAPSPS